HVVEAIALRICKRSCINTVSVAGKRRERMHIDPMKVTMHIMTSGLLSLEVEHARLVAMTDDRHAVRPAVDLYGPRQRPARNPVLNARVRHIHYLGRTYRDESR